MRLALVRALCATCIATAAGATPVDDRGHGTEAGSLVLSAESLVSTETPFLFSAEPSLGTLDIHGVSPLTGSDRREALAPAGSAPPRRTSLLETLRDLGRIVLATGLRDSLVLLLAAPFLALHLLAAARAVARRRSVGTAGFLALTCAAGILLFLARAGSPLDALAFRAWTTPASASAQLPFPALARDGSSPSDLLDPAFGERSRTAAVPVPEASPALLLALGIAALAQRRRDRA